VTSKTIYIVFQDDKVVAHCGSEEDARMMLNYGEGRKWIQSTTLHVEEYEAPSA